MRKCALLFVLLVVAIFLFKVSSSDTSDTIDKIDAKELVIMSEGEGLVKN